MVDADAQDLGIESCEAVKLGFVGRYLVGSDRGPGKGEKRQYHVFALKPLSRTSVSRWLFRQKSGAC